MSRFHSFEWEGLNVKVRPRRFKNLWWPLKWLPYRTGDAIAYRVSISGRSKVGAEIVNLGMGDVGYPGTDWNSPSLQLIPGTSQVLDVSCPSPKDAGYYPVLITFYDSQANAIWNGDAARIRIIQEDIPILTLVGAIWTVAMVAFGALLGALLFD